MQIKTRFFSLIFPFPVLVFFIFLLRDIRKPVHLHLKCLLSLLSLSTLLFISCQSQIAGGPGTSTDVTGRIALSDTKAAPNICVILSKYSNKIQWYTDRNITYTDNNGIFRYDSVDTGLYLLDATDQQGRRLMQVITLSEDLNSRQLGTYYIKPVGSLSGYINDNTDSDIGASARIQIYLQNFPICTLDTCNAFTIDSLPSGDFRVEILGLYWRHENSPSPMAVKIIDSIISISPQTSSIIDTIKLNEAALPANDSSIAELNTLKSLLSLAGSTQSPSASWFNLKTGRIRTIDIQSTNKMPLNEAIRMIATFPEIEKLRLSGFGGEAIPEILFSFENLSELSLTDGEITGIPERIADLKKLRTIQLGNNKITLIPDCLIDRTIPHLAYIDFTGNPLGRIEWKQQELINSLLLDEISVFLVERKLVINERDYRAILTLFEKNGLNDRMVHPYITTGSGLDDQDAIVTITINDATISIIPNELGNCLKLRSLHIFKNSIDTLPEIFESLSRLEDLHITNGTISVLPAQFNCTNIRTIDFTNNHIRHLPKWLILFSSLKYADFSNNCIDTANTTIPPKCIVNQLQCNNSLPAPDSLYIQDITIVNSIVNFRHSADLPVMDYIQCRNNRVVLLRVVLDDSIRLASFDTLCDMALKLDSLKSLHIITNKTTEKLPVTSKIFPQLEEFIGTGGGIQSVDNSFTISFPSLKNVALPGNKFSSIPATFKSLSSLTAVDLYFNRLTNLSTDDSLWLDLRSEQNRKSLWDSNFNFSYSKDLYWRNSQFDSKKQ